MGVSLSSIRRIDNGEQPSADFIVALCVTYGLGIGEAFEIAQTAVEDAA
jgi:putative transcriptional regulator